MIELGTMLDSLRTQLSDLNSRADDHDIVFDVGSVEIDMEVTTVVDGNAKGGLKFLVLNFEAGGGGSRSHSQRMRLTLTPRDRSEDGPLRIRDNEAERPR